MAEALAVEPALQKMLATGTSEVEYFVTDRETGVNLKSKMDWVAPGLILDLKTFSASRGKSIDRAVADAIWNEKYYRTAYFYRHVRMLADTSDKRPDFVLAFVESEEPHEVRIKVLRPTTAGQPNMYWMRAKVEVDGMIRRYAEYIEKFGDKPWRDEATAEPLIDEEMPGLAY
jgi:hypothetical protein